ncbi:MAG: isoprenoid biosynthesis glyoxalase ElbB [Planctomycetota bacterium]|jgi:enhancing lycopene biosynthesis protein 2
MKTVGVVLSGCGVFDGAEIHESVITLLALDRAGAKAKCLAPDVDQLHVVNHLTGEVAEGETRNVLVESARIARGEVTDVADVMPDDLDALILPGGFGAAKNLCTFGVDGPRCGMNEDVAMLIRGMVAAGKPVGAVCIAPATVARALEGTDVSATLTIGNDAGTAEGIEALGSRHVECPVTEFTVDEERKIVSTPAYMLAGRISEAAEGIEKLVGKVLELA